MRQEHLHAMVLHRRPYRETSFLVDFFTRDLGKVSAVCKGARNSKGDRKSLLQPFQPVSVGFSGRHELKNLIAIEAAASMFKLAGQALFCAMYVNELLNRVLGKEIPHPELFDVYQASLHRLAEGEPMEPVLREFELHLLDELGIAPDWQFDSEGSAPISPGHYYTFITEQGFVPVVRSSPDSTCIAGEQLMNIAARHWDAASLQAAKRIIRLSLMPLLGDKPLKSRELFLKQERSK